MATKKQNAKVSKVFHEWKAGELNIGKSKGHVPYPSGQPQAIAIALNAAGLGKKKKRKK